MIIFLMLFVFNWMPVIRGENVCFTLMEKFPLLKMDTFAHDVAHGIHSISIEDIKMFFGIDVSPVNNGIPTINLNLSDVDNLVLNDAPVAGYDQEFLTPGLRAMDLVMRRNSPDFMMAGANHFERIGHALHMQEMWTESSQIFRTFKRNPIQNDSDVCKCVTDTENNGVKRWLARIAVSLEQMVLGTGKTNEPDLNYDFKYRNIPESAKTVNLDQPVKDFNDEIDNWKIAEEKRKPSLGEDKLNIFNKLKLKRKNENPGFKYEFDDWNIVDKFQTKNQDKNPGFKYKFDDWNIVDKFQTKNQDKNPGFKYEFDNWNIVENQGKNPVFKYEINKWNVVDQEEIPNTLDQRQIIRQYPGKSDATSYKDKQKQLTLKDFAMKEIQGNPFIMALYPRVQSENGIEASDDRFSEEVATTPKQERDEKTSDNWQPGTVDGPQTWMKYKKMLKKSKQTETAARNLAFYLYCKLK